MELEALDTRLLTCLYRTPLGLLYPSALSTYFPASNDSHLTKGLCAAAELLVIVREHKSVANLVLADVLDDLGTTLFTDRLGLDPALDVLLRG